MSIPFDSECRDAVERAKRSVPPGTAVGVKEVLSALAHAPTLLARFPDLSRAFPAPKPWNGSAAPAPDSQADEKRPVADDLKPLLAQASESPGPVTVERLVAVVLHSPIGERVAKEAGLAADRFEEARKSFVLPPRVKDPQRVEARAVLSRRLAAYGRLLTGADLAPLELFERGSLLASVARSLLKWAQNNVLLVGPPGVGKTTLVREMARQMTIGGPLVPEAMWGWDLFEISSAFVTGGLYGGESVEALVTALSEERHLVVFVDDVGELLFPERARGMDVPGRTRLLSQLVEGPTPVVGTLKPRDLRRIQRDERWSEQFDVIRVPEPSEATALSILAERADHIRKHYETVDVPPAALAEVARVAREAMPALAEPLRSVRFLDEVCSVCVSSRPPLHRVDTAAIERTLHERGLAAGLRRARLSEAQVRDHLNARIIGQEAVVAEIARTFVAGLTDWTDRSRPRGVFLFGGPTGVGKTETAVLLAALLDPTGRGLIRINCNVLQGNSNAPDAVIWPLLGVPKGFVGHGEGGLLGPVQERPDSVILFDEFEKADPAVGKLLLQILDTGQQEDNDGNLLDFRRSYLIFTTNLGCDYEAGEPLGFSSGDGPPPVPTVDREDIFDDLLRIGYGQEFLGRIRATFLFQGLTREAVERVAMKILASMTSDLAERGLALAWDEGVVARVVSRWHPKLGVRHLAGLLQHRVVEQIAVADAEGRLAGVRRVRLVPAANPLPPGQGGAARSVEDGTLVISLD